MRGRVRRTKMNHVKTAQQMYTPTRPMVIVRSFLRRSARAPRTDALVPFSLAASASASPAGASPSAGAFSAACTWLTRPRYSRAWTCHGVSRRVTNATKLYHRLTAVSEGGAP